MIIKNYVNKYETVLKRILHHVNFFKQFLFFKYDIDLFFNVKLYCFIEKSLKIKNFKPVNTYFFELVRKNKNDITKV